MRAETGKHRITAAPDWRDVFATSGRRQMWTRPQDPHVRQPNSSRVHGQCGAIRKTETKPITRRDQGTEGAQRTQNNRLEQSR